MCLQANNIATLAISEILPADTLITVYKVFAVKYDYKYFCKCIRLKNFRLSGKHQNYDWNVGVHNVDAKGLNRTKSINQGIHVCLTRKEVDNIAGSVGDAIVQFQVPIKDIAFLGCYEGVYQDPSRSRHQAVLSKLEITQEIYDDAVKQVVDRLKKNCPNYFTASQLAA